MSTTAHQMAMIFHRENMLAATNPNLHDVQQRAPYEVPHHGCVSRFFLGVALQRETKRRPTNVHPFFHLLGLKPPGEKNMSSRDRFPLKQTGDNKPYSFQEKEAFGSPMKVHTLMFAQALVAFLLREVWAAAAPKEALHLVQLLTAEGRHGLIASICSKSAAPFGFPFKTAIKGQTSHLPKSPGIYIFMYIEKTYTHTHIYIYIYIYILQ